MTTLVSVLRKLSLWDWLRGRRGRTRRVVGIAIYGLVALVVIGAGVPSSKKQPSPGAGVRASGQGVDQQQTLPVERSHRRQAGRVRSQAKARREAAARARRREAAARARQREAARRRRAAAQKAQARVSVGCPNPSRVLDGVYHPDRLRVLDPCRRVSGTVILVRPPEEDGDLHFDVRLDSAYRAMLIQGNYSEQDGGLVVEFMPRDHGHLPTVSVGDRVSLAGAYVDDTDHGWNELHPVWSVSINHGTTYHSGPQYGGSPASVGSDSAAAACRTNTGAPCTGYGGATASTPGPSTTTRTTTTPTHGGGGSFGGGAGCTPGYSPCIPPGPDVDCAGGSGNGPRYVRGPVRVTGSDPYHLDTNGDGVGCDS